mmetsp:Transcript_66622/g.206591  ORF Transcript_66622/g.206591 Transcript_66622/m.206591 type:complete len:280 (-) Transcript_66622:13-852(-)
MQEGEVPPAVGVEEWVELTRTPRGAAGLEELHGLVQPVLALEVERVGQAVVEPGVGAELGLEGQALARLGLGLLVLALLLEAEGPHAVQEARRRRRAGRGGRALHDGQDPRAVAEDEAHDVAPLHREEVPGVPVHDLQQRAVAGRRVALQRPLPPREDVLPLAPGPGRRGARGLLRRQRLQQRLGARGVAAAEGVVRREHPRQWALRVVRHRLLGHRPGGKGAVREHRLVVGAHCLGALGGGRGDSEAEGVRGRGLRPVGHGRPRARGAPREAGAAGAS